MQNGGTPLAPKKTHRKPFKYPGSIYHIRKVGSSRNDHSFRGLALDRYQNLITLRAQSQTQFFEFDLSLTKIQFSAKTNATAHVQSQTQFLNLT